MISAVTTACSSSERLFQTATQSVGDMIDPPRWSRSVKHLHQLLNCGRRQTRRLGTRLRTQISARHRNEYVLTGQ